MDSEEEKKIMAGKQRAVEVDADAGTTAWTGGIYTPNRIPEAAATAHMAATAYITITIVGHQVQRRKTI